MKLLELRGPRTLRPLNVFSALMLGLKMLPAYATESYEDFLSRVGEMPRADQEKMIREALSFVDLRPEDVEGVCSFCADPNGVPYSSANIKNLGIREILEIIVAVCLEIVDIAVDFINDDEKKKLRPSQSTSDKSLPSIQH